ncbi:MAG: DUF3302 domain-containing protein [Verrucomicrobiales bacterium]
MLNYVSLGMLIFVALFLFYLVIILHDIPYEIAKKRNHPHRDAIHVAGWVSLLTLHLIWPFLWIWAMLYREDRGWGVSSTGTLSDDEAEEGMGNHDLRQELQQMMARVDRLEMQLEQRDPTEQTERKD